MQEQSVIERLARHLASENPEQWPSRIEDAASILAILKQPDSAMRDVGHVDIWGMMIDAALRERWTLVPPSADAYPPAGADEEGEIILSRHAVGDNRADWVHLEKNRETPS